MLDKDLYGYLSLVFVSFSGVSYLVSILKGQTRPHIFTWGIWSLVTAIAAASQYAGQAGPGAWSSFLSTAFCVGGFVLSLRYGEKNIKTFDWVALAVGLAAIPIWYVTSNPWWAALLATLIDASGYLPTFRKSYIKPHEEMAFPYVISNLKHIAAIMATTVYSPTTLVYPVVLFVMNAALVVMLWCRRYSLARRVIS